MLDSLWQQRSHIPSLTERLSVLWFPKRSESLLETWDSHFHDCRQFGNWVRTVNWRLPSTYRHHWRKLFFFFMVEVQFFLLKKWGFLHKKWCFYGSTTRLYYLFRLRRLHPVRALKFRRNSRGQLFSIIQMIIGGMTVPGVSARRSGGSLFRSTCLTTMETPV